MTEMGQHFLHRFDATEAAARDGLAAVMDRLRKLGLPQAAAGNVELALAEVVNNVVEHGYRGKVGGEILVEGRLSRTGLDLVVSDTGRPLPGGRVPPVRPIDPGTLRRDLPEGGFGWALIHQLTDALRYERRGARNRLSMRFRFSPETRRPARPPQTAP